MQDDRRLKMVCETGCLKEKHRFDGGVSRLHSCQEPPPPTASHQAGGGAESWGKIGQMGQKAMAMPG